MDASLKPKRRRSAEHSVDRLSALPDGLLHVVLSRLKARQVVRTCVLSTRWRHLWRSVPCLRIDQREFQAADGYVDMVDRQSFKNFTHIQLQDHDVKLLQEFRLHVGYCGGMRRHADSWVRRGISQDETWPCRLKRLHLTNVFLDDYFVRHIGSSCPVLEDMRLKHCSYSLTDGTVFTSYSLKKLAIVALREVEEEDWGLTIHAPALASLSLDGDCVYICGRVDRSDLTSLVEASIRLTVSTDNDNKDDGLVILQLQIQFLWYLINVTSLTLSHFGILFPSAASADGKSVLCFPLFENLKTLALVECDISDGFQTLEHFLRESPNLEKLTLRCCKLSDPKPRNEKMENARRCSKDMGSVECQNLRLTEIIYKDDDDDDSVHLLVKFLLGMLKNMPNKRIEITKVD